MKSRDYSLYDPATLELTGTTLSVPPPLLAINVPPGAAALEGRPPAGCRYVRPRADGAGVEFDTERRPPRPTEQHEWDGVEHAWVDSEARGLEARHRAIARLEAGTLRALREHALGLPGAAARLQAIDDDIKPHRDAIAAVRAAREARSRGKG